VRTESNVLNENLLGTQPLNCGTAVLGLNCTKDVLNYGAEFVGAYGPLSIQGEYMGAHYDRNPALIEFLKAPGAASLDFQRLLRLCDLVLNRGVARGELSHGLQAAGNL